MNLCKYSGLTRLRVILCQVPDNNADALMAVWNGMTSHIAAGDIDGALSYFSVAAVDDYRKTFLSVGKQNTASAVNGIGTLAPVYINDDRAEYYFTNTISGQTILFPVEFDKENGFWKILQF